jgi:HK97 family phage prohead protease
MTTHALRRRAQHPTAPADLAARAAVIGYCCLYNVTWRSGYAEERIIDADTGNVIEKTVVENDGPLCRLEPGAFAEALEDCVSLCWEHGEMLASTGDGTLSLVEDNFGLRFLAMIDPDDRHGRAVLAHLERGWLGASFAHRLDETTSRREGDIDIITAARLLDISLTRQAACPGCCAFRVQDWRSAALVANRGGPRAETMARLWPLAHGLTLDAPFGAPPVGPTLTPGVF